MRKTSVYLSEEEASRLATAARLEGRSQAEILRELISNYSPRGAPDRDFALTRSGNGPGGSVVDVPEDQLLDGFGE